MMDWTDRHCRYFHRLLSPHARLYTEMLTTGAIVHGGMHRFLDYDEREHPVALQLGGSEPADLAHCAKLAQQWGYDEVNLNCGCPSERVQRGAFGACLMNEASLVADCVKAMIDAVGGDPKVPITVKHRIGIDHSESYDFVRDFVGTVADVGCQVFIVHARNAWLKGLSPKENREIPPLRYEVVHRLKQDFPHLTIVLNGGLADNATSLAQLQPGAVLDGVALDGVMVGRAAYHTPWILSEWDELFFGQPARSQPLAPYHTHENPEALEPGKVYEFDIEIWPTCWVFKAGHRIRLELMSFDGQHHIGHLRGTDTFYHDTSRPSHLQLCVIPK